MGRTVRLGLTASMVILAGGLLLAAASGTAAAQEATTVTVVVQPTETVAGEPINGSPTVLVTSDTLVPISSAEVVVTVAEGPEDFASGSTIEYTDANGEVVFDDLVLNKPGTYRLQFEVSSSSAQPATTDAFEVVLDSDSIQAMVDAADPGDTIAVEPGTYEENVTIDTPDLTITAAGEERPHVEGGFLVRADGVTIADVNVSKGYGNGPGVRIEGADATIVRTAIDGTGHQGIYATPAADGVTVEDTHVRDTGASGVYLFDAGTATLSGVTVRNAGGADFGSDYGIFVVLMERVTVSGTSVHDAADTGIVFDASGDVTVSGVDVQGTGGAGIRSSGSGELTVTDTAVGNTTSKGIYGEGDATVSVEASDVRDTGTDGIELEGSGSITITDADVRATGDEGIVVGNSGPVTISETETRDTVGTGIRLVDPEMATVSTTDIRNSSDAGLEFHGPGKVTVSAVTVRETASFGLRFQSAADVTVTDVDVEDSEADGVVIDDTVLASIENVSVVDTARSGISANVSDTVSITGSNSTGAGEYGIRFVGVTEVNVSDAVVRSAGESGVFVNDADEATVAGVEVDTAGVNGVLVTQSGDVTVQNAVISNADRDGLAAGSSTTLTAVETVVRDAGRNGVSVRFVDTATLSGVELRNPRFDGVAVEDVGTISIVDSVIDGSATGVDVEDDSTTTITGSRLANNTVAVRNDNVFNRTTIDATNNWWGASDGPGGYGPGHGAPIFGPVDFEPYLTITSVDAFEVGPGFTGVRHDDGGVPVAASGFATDAFAVESGVALLEVAGQTFRLEIVDGEVNTTFDASASLGPTTETGIVTADLEGVRQDDLRLVHEAHTLDEGYTRWSIPQPAAIYTTAGVTDVTQWNASSYDDADFSTDDGSLVTDGADLHRGMFVYAETDGERLGYDFATPGQASLPPGGAEPIEEGWNLLGSNFDVSSNDNLTLNHDLATVTNLPATAADYTGEDPMMAYDPRSYNRLGGTHAVGPYETYWVYVDVGQPTEFRAIAAPEYDPAGGE